MNECKHKKKVRIPNTSIMDLKIQKPLYEGNKLYANVYIQ